MLAKDNQRAIRPPRARDLFGSEAESALRTWLSQQLPLSERRIVEYFEHRGRTAVKKYRELDALAFDTSKYAQVFEIKASQKATSLRRAARQLHDTRSILGMLLARVTTTILLVDTGIVIAADVAALMAGPEPPPDPPLTLDGALAALPQIRLVSSLDARPTDPELIGLLRFSVDDIIALVGAEQLHLDWEDNEAEDLEQPVEETNNAPATDAANEESDEESAFAAALRKAMQPDEAKQRKR
jgi:hypothetical protein